MLGQNHTARTSTFVRTLARRRSHIAARSAPAFATSETLHPALAQVTAGPASWPDAQSDSSSASAAEPQQLSGGRLAADSRVCRSSTAQSQHASGASSYCCRCRGPHLTGIQSCVAVLGWSRTSRKRRAAAPSRMLLACTKNCLCDMRHTASRRRPAAQACTSRRASPRRSW